MSSVNVDSSLAIMSLNKKKPREIRKKEEKKNNFEVVLTVFHFPKVQEKYGK